MTEVATCGQGLAHHAALPRTMGGLLTSIADNLSAHLVAVVGDEPASRQERRAYDEVEERLRAVAAMLETVGEQMSSHRDLPLARHDPTAMSSPAITGALESMVRAETDLVALLGALLADHEAMLAQLRA